ncbi:MAG: sugar phosphate isomerase/epimerase [Planctomycetes bacterium]|nr:sugar phosphate isomerase/epimerase [Planctomycetota bacterium]
MIKSISYWSMPKGLENTESITSALATAKNAGFAGLELCIGPEGVLNTATTQAECADIRQQIDASGLVVETLASGMSWGVNPVSNDPAVRVKAVELHEAALERAAWLGCSAMLFVPGVVNSPIAPDERVRYDHALERVSDNVRRLLDTAERVGVDLCLENVWNGLFYSPVEFAQFIDSFGSDRLGVYFDVGNVLGYQQYPPHWIELLGSRIKRVHIKDFKDEFGWEGRYAFCDLLQGQVPFPETMAALRAIGYDKTIVAEMMPWRPDLLEVTSRAMDTILVPA